MSAHAPDPGGSRPKCGAKLRNGGSCGRSPMKGQARCDMHGGKTPSKMAKARRTLAESKVRESLEKAGVREVENPLAELQALTSEVVAFKDWAARHVAALEDRIRFTDERGAEQLRAEVLVYERALDRAGKFLEMWARLGLDAMLAEMRVRVTEGQVKALTAGLEAYRAAAAVPEEQHQAGLAAMAKAMRS